MIDEKKVLDVIEDLECELSFCRAVECNTSTIFVSDLESYLDVINGQKAEIEALIAGQETLQKYIAEKDAEIESLERRLHNSQLHQKETHKALQNERALRLKEEFIKSEAVKEFAESVINDILPEFTKGHEEMALRISFAISQKAKEMECKTDA